MLMKYGMEPSLALNTAMAPIKQYYPSFFGAMVAVNSVGTYGMFTFLQPCIDLNVYIFTLYIDIVSSSTKWGAHVAQ